MLQQPDNRTASAALCAFPSANMPFKFSLGDHLRCWLFPAFAPEGEIRGYAVMSDGV